MAEEIKAEAQEKKDEPRPPRFAARVLFVVAALLDAALIHLQHYSPFDVWSNLSALAKGIAPADIFWGAAAASILSLIIFWRLLPARVPTAANRWRPLTALLGVPVWLASSAAFEFALAHYLGHYSDPSGQVPRLLLLIGGGAVAVAGMALLVALGLSEGSGGGPRRALRLFLRLWPLAALLGAPALALRHLSLGFLILPVAGPVLRAGFNLWLQLALAGTLARMVRPGHQAAEPDPPGIIMALPSSLAAIITFVLFILLPPPPYHFNALAAPPLAADEARIGASGFDDRDRKVTYSSQRMTLVVGQDPFDFGVLDQNRRMLLKLLIDPERDAGWRGVASNFELRGIFSLPLGGNDRLVRSRFQLWSTPLAAAHSLRLSAGELIAESRLGSRPLLVTFVFVDDDVLKITVDAGARMSFHSTSIAFACGETEKFFGLGSLGGTDLRGRDLDLLVEPGDALVGGSLLRRLSRGRADFALGADHAFWPAPMIYFSRGLGIFFAETVDPRVELASRYPDAVRFSGRGGPLTLYVVRGDHPEEIIARMKLLVGERSVPPAPALLPWMALTEPGSACGEPDPSLQKQSAGYVLVTRAAWGGPDGPCPGLNDFIAAGRKQGLRFIFEDTGRLAAEGPLYEEAGRRGYLALNRVGLPLRRLTTNGPQAVIDFSHPAVLKWRLTVWKRMRELGFEGMALDPLAQVPPEAELYNGESGYIMRNAFPLIYAACASKAWGKSAMLTASAGYTGMERFVPVLQREGPDTYPLLASLGLSGAPAVLSPLSTANGFLPLMMLPGPGAGKTELERSRLAVEAHLSLFPYLYSLLAAEAGRGMPALLPPAITAPQEDFGPDEYFLGRNLLVAVPPAGAASMSVRFPRGGWRQVDTLSYYGPGPREVKVAGRPTAFLLESSVIPLLTGETPHRAKDLDPAAPLALLLHPGPEALFKLYDGTEFVSRHFPNSLLLEVSGETQRDYSWRVLDQAEPTSVFKDSLRQTRQFWQYQDRARLLTLPQVAGPSHRIEVVTPDEVIVDPSLEPPPPRK